MQTRIKNLIDRQLGKLPERIEMKQYATKFLMGIKDIPVLWTKTLKEPWDGDLFNRDLANYFIKKEKEKRELLARLIYLTVKHRNAIGNSLANIHKLAEIHEITDNCLSEEISSIEKSLSMKWGGIISFLEGEE